MDKPKFPGKFYPSTSSTPSKGSPNKVGRPDLWGGGLFAFASIKHFLVEYRYGRRPNPSPNPSPSLRTENTSWSDTGTGVDPTLPLTLALVCEQKAFPGRIQVRA